MAFSILEFSRTKTFKMLAAFAGGNLVATLFGVIGSLVQARYVSPEDMGVFRVFSVLAGYLTFLHLGVIDGLQREIPVQIGKGNTAQAEKSASACLSWIILVSAMCTLGFLVCSVLAALRHDWMRFWGWLAFIPFIISTFYGTYLGTTYRTGQQFVSLSRINVAQSVAGIFILPLYPILGYFGACLRTAATSITQMVLLHARRPMRVRPCLSWRTFFQVIRVGFPLSIVGYIYTALWISIEGTIILSWYGKRALGLYAVAAFIRTVVMQLALSLNQIIGVRVYQEYGRTGRVANCWSLALKPTFYGALLSIPVVAMGWATLPSATKLLIPGYVDATLMMQILLPMMTITIMELPAVSLWASAKLKECFLSVGAGLISFLVSACFLKHSGFGASAILVASVFGQLVRVLVSYVLILRLIQLEKEESQLFDSSRSHPPLTKTAP